MSVKCGLRPAESENLVVQYCVLPAGMKRAFCRMRQSADRNERAARKIQRVASWCDDT